MKKNLSATLDLVKVIQVFIQTVKPLLELERVESWDGSTIKEREQAIRDAALILAGESIALLLYNLSQSPIANQTAENQTKGWWRTQSRNHGRCWRQVLTMGNVVVDLYLPYVVERCPKPKGQKKSNNQGFCPFLYWLGMSEGITPLVWSTIAQYGTMSSSFATAYRELSDWGIDVSLRIIERLTYYFGQVGLSLRQSKVFNLKQGTLVASPILKDQRVVISADGGRTRIRINKKGRRRSKTNRRGFTGVWVEPKLLTIYGVDEKGKKLKAAELPITNDGTYGDYKVFMELLEMHLVSLGITEAKQILLIADGAEWIWIHIPPLLERLGVMHKTDQLLYFYHVAQHLQTFSEVTFDKNDEQSAWFKKARNDLKKGKAANIIERMKEKAESVSGAQRKLMDTQINYLIKGLKLSILSYDLVAAKNMPIGSGAIESLIRQSVNLRMKGNGKFWLKDNAEIMLHARCQWLAGSWNNFSRDILRTFIYPLSS